MASVDDAGNFDASLGCLFASALDGLATQLAEVAGISAAECSIVLAATRKSLCAVLHTKLGRLLILELNAARVTGRLDGADAPQRWDQFLEISAQPAFWDELSQHYPTMLARVHTIVRNRCTAAFAFAQRFALHRSELADLLAQQPGELLQLSFGAGDSHRQGQAVALLRCAGGRLVYKPRSLAIDIALFEFVAMLRSRHPDSSSIRVPRSLDRADHGWAEFIAHQYAQGDSELTDFYRGVGHWLAIMRLLGGSDLHAENLIAHAGSPVVVDCETLFTPLLIPKPSGLGLAADRAAQLVSGTVLNIGLLPGRGIGLGWRGVDSSAVGMLPGQQPMMPQPGIVDAGTDLARIGSTLVEPPVSQNHPSAEPALVRFWPEVLQAFEAMTNTLQVLDDGGALIGEMQRFSECQIRVVPRATEVYAEIGRMLWHPVSLHNEAPARQRAFDLLLKMSANVASAPSDPVVIRGEIEDLLEGDVPFFTTRVRIGELDGPRASKWLPPQDLAQAALAHWRAADFSLERNVIRTALVSAYINQGWMPDEVSLRVAVPRRGEVETRRRAQAARIMREVMASAIRGEDGSVSWISPVLGPIGWSVQPVDQDLYAGASGIAVLAGAYLREMQADRADPIEGVEALFRATLRTLDLAQAKRDQQRQMTTKLRPLMPGGYIGLGSQIWTRLWLAEWGMDDGRGLQRACSIAQDMPQAAAADDLHDVLSGKSGAIPPLLWLAAKTGDAHFLQMASTIGDSLCDLAQWKGARCYWTHSQWPEGVGGFAHGVTGIGWALTKLGRKTGGSRYLEVAAGAFAFEDALFDAEEKSWLDLRMLDGLKTAAAWCHGSVGIGLAAVDLDPGLEKPKTREVLRLAAASTWRIGMGWNHCACHGDLSAWELLDLAIGAGEGPPGLDRSVLLEGILSSLETHGPTCGLTREAFVPGLMPGIGGVAYQLLRAHPQSGLPSILTLSGGGI